MSGVYSRCAIHAYCPLNHPLFVRYLVSFCASYVPLFHSAYLHIHAVVYWCAGVPLAPPMSPTSYPASLVWRCAIFLLSSSPTGEVKFLSHTPPSCALSCSHLCILIPQRLRLLNNRRVRSHVVSHGAALFAGQSYQRSAPSASVSSSNSFLDRGFGLPRCSPAFAAASEPPGVLPTSYLPFNGHGLSS